MILALILCGIFFSYIAHIYNNRPNWGINIMNQNIKATVTLYTKPSCMYCVKAKGFLQEMNIKFNEHDVTNDHAKRKELIESTGSRTVPYIFINDNYIGGCSDMLRMAEDGSLEKMLVM